MLLRDLEELRAKRIALENPTPIQPPVEEEAPAVESPSAQKIINDLSESPQPVRIIPTDVAIGDPKESEVQRGLGQVAQNTPKETVKPVSVPTIPAPTISVSTTPIPAIPLPAIPVSTTPVATIPVPLNPQQALTPPESTNESNGEPHIGSLDINTQVTTTASAPDTADFQDSSIDSLFDMTETENKNNDSQQDFDNMDFSNEHTQNSDFDLSTFGNSTQDFNMIDFHTTDTNTANNTITADSDKKEGDDLFSSSQNNATSGNMDLDLDLDLGPAGGDDSVFDDMIFFDGGNDGSLGGSGEMEHGDYDNAFFGIGN